METQNITLSGRQFNIQVRDNIDQSVAAEIFKHKEYRRADKIIAEAKNAIIDVGAHAGYFSIYCHVLNPSVPIFSLEPEANNFQFLKENIKINKIKKIYPIDMALSAKSGITKLYLSSDSHNHTLISSDAENIENSKKISAISLNDLLHKYKIKSVDLIKMDIEAGEYDVLENLSKKDLVPVKNIIFEYHNYGGRSYKALETHLRENGFGVEVFPSKFDKKMGFIFAQNKSIRRV